VAALSGWKSVSDNCRSNNGAYAEPCGPLGPVPFAHRTFEELRLTARPVCRHHQPPRDGIGGGGAKILSHDFDQQIHAGGVLCGVLWQG